MEQTFRLPPEQLRLITFWVNEWGRMWRVESPQRLHSRSIDAGGAPEWHPEFARYLTREDREDHRQVHHNPDQRLRTTRAFRKLRNVNAREFEVLYRTSVKRLPLEETTTWLNERARRAGKPEHYTLADTQVLLLSAVHKVLQTW